MLIRDSATQGNLEQGPQILAAIQVTADPGIKELIDEHALGKRADDDDGNLGRFLVDGGNQGADPTPVVKLVVQDNGGQRTVTEPGHELRDIPHYASLN